MSDAYGKALSAYFNGDKKTRIKVESSVVETEYWNIKEFFHTWEQMSEIEHRALKLCKGRTLDVGAGSGSHTLWLQDNGVDVDAIDVSAGAVDVMRQRGVRNAQIRNFYDIAGEKYDTLLMLMNGAGIAKTMKNLPSFLNHCKSILSDGGQIVMDSSDLIYLYTDEDGNVDPGIDDEPYYGEIDYFISYRGEKDDSFEWLFVDFNRLNAVCQMCGLKAEKVYENEHYQYLVVIRNV